MFISVDIISCLSLFQSKTTITRFIRKNNFKCQNPTKKIILTEKQKKDRIEFVKTNISRDWSKIIFSDEKKFNLRGTDSYFKYWGNTNNEKKMLNRNNFNDGGIMVHLTTSYNGMILLVEIQDRFNSEKFCDPIKNKVLPLVPPYFPHSHFIFQQDNCPIHKSAYSRMFFKRKKIETLNWPSSSPDLNICENIFAYLSQKLYSCGKVYQSKNDLWENLSRVFKEVEIEYIRKLYDSMSRRMCDVLTGQGKLTNYQLTFFLNIFLIF